MECRVTENNLSKNFQEQIQFRSCNVSTQDEYFANVSVEIIKHQIFGIVKQCVIKAAAIGANACYLIYLFAPTFAGKRKQTSHCFSFR